MISYEFDVLWMFKGAYEEFFWVWILLNKSFMVKAKGGDIHNISQGVRAFPKYH